MAAKGQKKITEPANFTKQQKTAAAIIAIVVVLGVVAFAGVKGNKGEGLGSIAPASAASAENGDDAPMIKLGNPVVAVVNGKEINRSEVFNFISALPEQVRQMPIQNLFPMALDQVVSNSVIGIKADGANLNGDPEVEQRLNDAKEQIIRTIYVERQIDEQLTQKRLLKEYEKLLESMSGIKETRARHILVEDEAKAREIIKELDGGADFAALAKEKSTGPSAEAGGELGYFAKNEMVPEFAEAAFALAPGQYSKDPVKTQFGWHVIKAEERRDRPEPTFEQVKPQLEAQLRQKILAELLDGWQKEAKIKKYDINGNPVK